MRLRVGSHAPDFVATTVDGKTFALRDLNGQPRLLSFYRYASCPLCNVRLHELLGRWPDYAKDGLLGISVFQSPPASVAMHMARHDAPFRLVPDPDEALYKLYGLESSVTALLNPINLGKIFEASKLGYPQKKIEGTKTRLPADFLIDKHGLVRELHYGKTLYDHIPYTVIERFLATYR
ncbi:MAG TPA: peroxiredoxin family protein [Myxococcota bacterium]|nr:peroxiredoxin family protein [Myxococcota bacterium]